MDNLLLKLVEDTHTLLGNNFVFQQDGAPPYWAMQTQEWFGKHCLDFTDKDSWPPNGPDLILLDYCGWETMLEVFNKINSKPQNTSEMKTVLQTI